MCGAVAALLPGADVACYTPGEWTRGIPKKTTGSAKTGPRALRILSRLSDAERAVVPDSHDALDAVGLGLYRLGRFERRRVLPGAT